MCVCRFRRLSGLYCLLDGGEKTSLVFCCALSAAAAAATGESDFSRFQRSEKWIMEFQ